jgi:hypothetical protein
MKPEEGIARIGLGFGQILETEDAGLRFSPAYPSAMPQFSTVDDILAHAQRFFYALKLGDDGTDIRNLEKREVADAEDEFPIKTLASVYIPEEHRIRDSGYLPGPKIMTFAPILKHGLIPLPEIISDLLDMGRKGMGGPVEIEFSVNLGQGGHPAEFHFLQLRPLSQSQDPEIRVRDSDIREALCFSEHSLGHGRNQTLKDMVFVKPENFNPAATARIAREISGINAALSRENRPYLLIGPGRWGSADPWLGIPAAWGDISGVGAMIELRDGTIHADPSQGSHFFQKIISRRIHYITLEKGSSDNINWPMIMAFPVFQETLFLRHIRFDRPLILKNDARTSRCVIIEG